MFQLFFQSRAVVRTFSRCFQTPISDCVSELQQLRLTTRWLRGEGGGGGWGGIGAESRGTVFVVDADRKQNVNINQRGNTDAAALSF